MTDIPTIVPASEQYLNYNYEVDEKWNTHLEN